MSGGEMFVIGVVVGMVGASLILAISFTMAARQSKKNDEHKPDLGPWIINKRDGGLEKVEGTIRIFPDERSVRINDEDGYLRHMFFDVVKISRGSREMIGPE